MITRPFFFDIVLSACINKVMYAFSIIFRITFHVIIFFFIFVSVVSSISLCFSFAIEVYANGLGSCGLCFWHFFPILSVSHIDNALLLFICFYSNIHFHFMLEDGFFFPFLGLLRVWNLLILSWYWCYHNKRLNIYHLKCVCVSRARWFMNIRFRLLLESTHFECFVVCYVRATKVLLNVTAVRRFVCFVFFFSSSHSRRFVCS